MGCPNTCLIGTTTADALYAERKAPNALCMHGDAVQFSNETSGMFAVALLGCRMPGW